MIRMDGAVRVMMTLAVTVVAAVAGWVSYWHCVEFVSTHGEDMLTARIMPATVDGLVVATSLVLLDCARHHRPTPLLAWLMLGVGIAATLAANVAHGLPAGPAGAVIAAWPAVALVGTGEMALRLVRGGTAGAVTPVADIVTPVRHLDDTVAEDWSHRGDRLSQARTIVTANPQVTGTQLARMLGVSTRTGQRLRTQVAS